MQNVGLTDADVFCVSKLPQGEFADQIIEWLEEDASRRVIVFETDESCLLQTPLHERIKICCLGGGEALKQVLWEHVFLSFDFAQDFSRDLLEKVEYFQKGIHLVASAYKERGLDLLENIFKNSSLEALDGKGLFGAFRNRPAIILGAGASLEDEIPLLKTLKDSALLFAGGTTLASLEAFSIQPHFGGAVDPYLPPSRMVPHKGPLFFQSRAHPEVVSKALGPLLKIPGSESDFFEEESFDGGWNVTTFLTALACHMGCTPIVLVGVDLAQTKEKTYAAGLDREEGGELIEVGEGLFTRSDWLMAAKWLSEFANEHPEVEWINASKGLTIQGMEIRSLREVVFEPIEDLKEQVSKAIASLEKKGFSSSGLTMSFARAGILCLQILEHIEKIYPKDLESSGEYALLQLELEKEKAFDMFLSKIWDVWKYVFAREVSGFGYEVNKWLFMKGICDDI